MKVKDQLRVRREQLGISVNELAKRLGVSSQAIRHWENGRSFPGKSKTVALETALSFHIDWTEGARASGPKASASSMIDPKDVELLLKIARLPPPAKALFSSLVELQLTAYGTEVSISDRVRESPARPFYDKPGEHEGVTQAKQRSKPAKTTASKAGPHRATRRKAA